MDIHFTSLQPKISTDLEKQDNNCENTVAENLGKDEIKVYPDANIMRAYSNVKPSESTVSRQEALEFIQAKVTKNEKTCEKFLNILTDSDGYIKTETLDFVEKASNKLMLMNWIENSKENGKINHNVLKMLESALPDLEKGYNDSFNLPNYFKDKNGNFNNDLIDLMGTVIKENPKQIQRFISLFSKIYLTNDKVFDKNAIAYHKEQSSDKKLVEVFDDIYFGKDDNGKFSKERLDIFKELKPHMEVWQAKDVLKYLDQAADKKEFTEIAKNLKTNDDLLKIFETISDIRANENDKTNLNFNKASVDFIRELRNANCKDNNVTDILKKINIPYNEYTSENKEIINKLLTSTYGNETHVEQMLNAAVYKAGDKKGQFSFDNLKKYIDIYNNSQKNIDEVNFISNTLSLETDDYALDTINKLYNLSWEKESQFGTATEKINKASLHLILKLGTSTKNSLPTKQFPKHVLDDWNKLMNMRLPMTSKGAFQNFMAFGEFDVIEKMEKVRLDEIGIDTGDMTKDVFKTASEEELQAFKDYMMDFVKDKNPKYIEVNLNTNIKDLVEIKYRDQSVLYNMVKKQPVATRDDSYGREVVLKDSEKNITVKQVFSKRNNDKILYSQVVEKYDNDGNLQYTEEMKRSEIDGVYNVIKKYPDGRVEDVVKAQKTKEGNTLVEKNLTSPEGVKTYYRYEDDVNGNKIMDYKIVDTDGKVLMNQSSTFEVLDENHFISSRNKKSYDIKFNTDSIEVKNMQSGETKIINVLEFTKGSQNSIIPLLKKIPGDELFKMKEINLKSLSLNNDYANAAFSPKEETIGISQKYLDAGVLLHEFGHAKDEMAFKEISEEIVNDSALKADYQKEKAAAREFHSEAELDHLAYFGADYHYLGDKELREGIAESNMILDVMPTHEVNAVRAHYWMQDFPRVIAKLSNLLY